MAKYQVKTDQGTYLVETADPDPLTAGAPDAGAQMRAEVLNRASAMMDDNSAPVPMHPYGGADLLQTPVGNSFLQAPQRGAISMVDGAAQIANAGNAEHTARQIAGGAHKVISGGLGILSPTLGAAGIAAPVETGLGLLAGTAASKATEAGLKAAGVPDEYSDLAGDAAGIVGGGAAAHYGPAAVGGAADAVANAPGRVLGTVFKPRLDPAEASAVQYGHDNNVQMPTSVLTGSKVAANAENILQNLPLASGVAKTARAGEQQSLAAAGANELEQLRPGAIPAQPLDAGDAIHKQLDSNIATHSAAADDSYSLLRSIEAQPQFTKTVQVGTKQVVDPTAVDDMGNPVYKTVPVMEDIQLPVDLRPTKAALQPVYERMKRKMTLVQQQADNGFHAIQQIVNGPDYESASITDENLGGVKQVARETHSPVGQGLAKFAVQQLDQAVRGAVARAGPDAVAALEDGRAATIRKYGAMDVKDSLPAEPVQLAETLTRDKDRSINLLQSVAEQAPEQMPALAQSVVQGLIDKATAEAGMGRPTSALRKWNDLGDQTKALLFGDRTKGLTDFFTLHKKIAENPNPSGSGSLVAMGKAGLMIATQPHIGIPALIGSKWAAKMLFNPEGSRLMRLAMKTPADSPGASLIGKQLAGAMGGDAAAAAAPAAAGAAAAPSAPQPQGGLPSQPSAAASTDTVVKVPGEANNSYKANYAVKELADLQASHNGLTFQPNPKYGLTNDRNYGNAVNQGKIVGWASRSEFDPTFHVTDNGDATNGPPVVDAQGNVLGGNGRKMILDRVNAGNPDGAAAYRDLLTQKAGQFGIDPATLKDMKKPVLVREVPDSEFSNGRTKQNAVTDFNKKGTAELTPGEQAIADSRRVSPETLEHVAGRLEAKGSDATISDVLEGKAGGEVLSKLVSDGVVSPQEQAKLVTDQGELTPAGRDRISKLMVGRFFKDSSQLDSIAPSLRNKIERIAAPLAQVEGRPEWNLTPDVQQAVDILHRAQVAKIKSVDDFIQQDGLFGKQKYSDRAQDIAKAVQSMKSTDLTKAFRQYAGDANFAAGGDGMFGAAPKPETSLADAFADALKAAAEKAAAAPQPKNALAGTKADPAANAAMDARRDGGQKGSLTLGNDRVDHRPAPFRGAADVDPSESLPFEDAPGVPPLSEVQPVTKSVDLDSLTATQGTVSKSTVSEMAALLRAGKDFRGGDLPEVVQYQGVRYIIDGHHSLAAELANGSKAATVKFFDLDAAKPKNSLAPPASVDLSSVSVLEHKIADIPENASNAWKSSRSYYLGRGAELEVGFKNFNPAPGEAGQAAHFQIDDPAERGKGLGQKLYLRALQDGPIEMKAPGAKDLSDDALRVREALLRKNLAHVTTAPDGTQLLTYGPAPAKNSLAPKK